MTRIPRSSFALLAGAALIVTPAAAFAQNEVSDQAEVVAEKAEDLQAATNSLTDELADQEAAAAAANAATADGDRDATDGDRDRDDDDDMGKWGLLGLLGLAGLLGLKRRDDHIHHDRHHDNHTTTTGTTRTGTDTTRL